MNGSFIVSASLSSVKFVSRMSYSLKLPPPTIAWYKCLVGNVTTSTPQTIFNYITGLYDTIYNNGWSARTFISTSVKRNNLYTTYFMGCNNIQIPSVNFSSTPIITVCAWLCNTGDGNGAYGNGINQMFLRGNGFELFLNVTNGNMNLNNTTTKTGNFAHTFRNIWTHVSITLSSTVFKIYVDGLLYVTFTNAPTLTGSQVVQFSATGMPYFDGYAQDIRVYNKEFTLLKDYQQIMDDVVS